MKINIAKSTDKMLGGLRLSDQLYDKISALATKGRVSKQEIIRAILNQVIDDVEI